MGVAGNERPVTIEQVVASIERIKSAQNELRIAINCLGYRSNHSGFYSSDFIASKPVEQIADINEQLDALIGRFDLPDGVRFKAD